MRRLIVLLALLLSLLSVSALVQAQDSDSPIIHVVQPGENLFRISLRYGVALNELASANGITNLGLIFVGQQLTIPGTTGGTPAPAPSDPAPSNPAPSQPSGNATTYTVQAGDTLSTIARRFNTTFTAIAAANGIANPNLIYVGQVLSINGGTVSTPPPSDGGNVVTNPPPPNTAPITGFALGGQVTQGNYPYTDAMRQTGMTWVKRQIRWDGSAPASNFRGEIDAAQSRGFRILLSVVGDHNQLASNPSQYYQNFANFLGGLAAEGADAIEVWNEPNIEREWPAGQINGANYTQMLSAAYQVIKANNPNTLVISGAPSPTGFFGGNCTASGCDDNAFLAGMRSAGAANFMDCVGIHYNAGAVPPSATSGAPVGSSGHYSWYYPSMVNLYRSNFPGIPLCFTEIGYVSADGFPQGIPSAFAWAAGNSVQDQANWLAQAAVAARNSGAVRLFIVWNVDSTVYTDDPQAGYAIVRPDGNCPACNTIATALGG